MSTQTNITGHSIITNYRLKSATLQPCLVEDISQHLISDQTSWRSQLDCSTNNASAVAGRNIQWFQRKSSVSYTAAWLPGQQWNATKGSRGRIAHRYWAWIIDADQVWATARVVAADLELLCQLSCSVGQKGSQSTFKCIPFCAATDDDPRLTTKDSLDLEYHMSSFAIFWHDRPHIMYKYLPVLLASAEQFSI